LGSVFFQSLDKRTLAKNVALFKMTNYNSIAFYTQ